MKYQKPTDKYAKKYGDTLTLALIFFIIALIITLLMEFFPKLAALFN